MTSMTSEDAISKELSCKSVFLLHGPHGFGKTTAVVEIILQEVKRGSNILVCAASSIAVDYIVERLVPQSSQVLNGKLLKTKDKNTKREIRKGLKTLNKEERKRQQLAVQDAIKCSDVVWTFDLWMVRVMILDSLKYFLLLLSDFEAATDK